MKRVGLFIGIDKYKHGIQELECASEDALALGTLFAKKGFDKVEYLQNSKATGDAIVSRVMDLTADLKAGDLFVLYFAGHGVEYDGKHYLIGANGFKSAKVKQGRLETGELLDISGEIAGLNRMFILDCCRKDLVAGRGVAYACPEKWNSRDISLGFGGRDAGPQNVPPFIITSCSGGEQSYELKDREHGVFTSALLTVLNDARDSVRGFGQLIGRVDEAMRQLAPGRDCPQHMTASFNPGIWDKIPLFADWQTTSAAASTPESIPAEAQGPESQPTGEGRREEARRVSTWKVLPPAAGGQNAEVDSEKSYTKFIMLSALPLPFGQGYFYIGRKRLGVIAALIGVLSLVFAVISTLCAWHYFEVRASDAGYEFRREMDERRQCAEVARNNLRTIDKYLENVRYSDKIKRSEINEIKKYRNETSRFINGLNGYSQCSTDGPISHLFPEDLREQLESYRIYYFEGLSWLLRRMYWDFSDLLSYEGFWIPWSVFFGVYLLQLIAALFVKTDGDGKTLK